MLKGSDDTEKGEKTHYRFLQKYYHKGAFFLDNEDPILKRDYNIAVGEDMFDKSALPSVLKKRRGNFGKKGQSKYTHLTDQVLFLIITPNIFNLNFLGYDEFWSCLETWWALKRKNVRQNGRFERVWGHGKKRFKEIKALKLRIKEKSIILWNI